MALSEQFAGIQRGLKEELQRRGRARDLEKLAAVLLSRLLNVPIAVAGSGFQHGGDAGSAGQQGRHLRLECKKYADTTNPSVPGLKYRSNGLDASARSEPPSA